jgi:hypothetical protein
MKFRPLHDRVVLTRIDAEAKTAGGIISLTPPRKSRKKAGSSPSDLEGATKPARSFRSTSRSAIGCCSANGRAPRSRSMASST